MKILLSFSLITILLFSGCNNKPNKEKSNVVETTQEKKGSILIDTETFYAKVADIKNNSSEWKYLGDKPAIVDFYATWCGPCKQLAPIMDQLAEEYKGQIYIYKVDVDKSPELAKAFAIRSIPTLFFIPMEGKPQISQGARGKENLKMMIEKELLNKK